MTLAGLPDETWVVTSLPILRRDFIDLRVDGDDGRRDRADAAIVSRGDVRTAR